MTKSLAGIFAPLTTPFINEQVDLDHLRDNVQKYANTPLSGLFVLGSNGENKSLTEEEKLLVLETVVRDAGQRLTIIAGTGFESTRQTIEFSRRCQAIGADFVSLLSPSYYRKNLGYGAMVKYYSDVADALTIPVVIYNAPDYSGVTLSTKIVETLCKHPNIAGMKDTSGNFMKYLAVAGAEFHVLAGSINYLLPTLMLGGSGGVVSLADVLPEACDKLYRDFLGGNLSEAQKDHRILLQLGEAISGTYGVAGVKCAMDLVGYFGGPPRLPLLPLTDVERDSIRRTLLEADSRMEGR